MNPFYIMCLTTPQKNRGEKLKKYRKNKRQAGFSLIESAIVLVIMGFLIGGILKGKDLIESARLKRVISQVNEFRLATSAFLDKYEALPGDFNKASSLIHKNLKNGDGNGIIDGKGLETESEALNFWSHLAGAELIGSTGSLGQEKIGDFGKGAPEASIGGGFTIENNPRGLTGHWFILGKKVADHGDGGLLTPLQAHSIDKKLDNGHPSSGKVRAMDGSNVSSHACVSEDGFYNMKNHEPVCILLFQL
jgi:prepilin-type N-terminal cleavage/methylation domain-containing protein